MQRTATLLLATLGLSAVVGVAAFASVTDADRTPTVSIQQIVAEPDGTTRMTVQVAGLEPGASVDLDQLEIVENGVVVENARLAGSDEEEFGGVIPALVIALDVSGSTQGEPIEAARTAAIALVEEVTAAGGLVGVVGFGETTETIAPLSADGAAATRGIAALEAGGGTALRDGVARAARILASHDGPRDVVVFSDGEDTTSQSSFGTVRALLDETDVRVTSVVLRSESFAIEPLEALAAVNDGRVVEVEDARQLSDAFSVIAGDLTNRLDIVWQSDPVSDPPDTLNVVASYEAGGVVASDGVQVSNPRLPEVTPPREVEAPSPLIDSFASSVGLTVAAVAVGLTTFLLLYLILAGAGERRRRDALDDRLAAYQAPSSEQGREDHVTLSQRASHAFDVVPRPAGLDAKIASSIEKADWPMRVSEFMLLTLATALLGVLVGGLVLGSAIVALMGGIGGALAPWAYLRLAVSRRQSAFAEQLPTILQVLAGSLRAGHGFSTALEGAVEETDEPAKGELRRASVEGRLGRPLDRALRGVAERMESEDLQWVIGALEVQREVGGNLAEILSNVAATLRDRASIGRHVKALTAEGRLSALLISFMPFGMFGFLSVSNPDYLRPLYVEPLGRIMLGTGVILLVVGVIVLNRLVKPKY